MTKNSAIKNGNKYNKKWQKVGNLAAPEHAYEQQHTMLRNFLCGETSSLR